LDQSSIFFPPRICFEEVFMASFLSFDSVEYSYPSSADPVLKNISFELSPRGPSFWTGVSGENGAGKTTLLLLASGLLEPSRGLIRRSGLAVYCPQRTDEIPFGWEELFYSGDNEAGRLMSRLKLEADWPCRWDSLSHGERKRLQLAVSLWANPRVLALDEPTNHLDQEGRELVREALTGYEGIGLLVSHERTLLDSLCGQCLFLREGFALMRPGGISQGLAEEEREVREARTRQKVLRAQLDRLEAEAERRRRLAGRAKNRLSKKHLDPKDHDGRAKVNLGRLTGMDAAGTNLYKRMKNRAAKAREYLSHNEARPDSPRGITLRGDLPRADRLFFIEAGSLHLGAQEAREGRCLEFPVLAMRPGERVALCGPNGSGKSTLIRHILNHIPPRIPVLYLPQELSSGEGAAALARFKEKDEKLRGEILSRFSRLGSDPLSLLQSRLPSPGELRKLLIAQGIFLNPALLVMDEPANHLDLGSIRLLEESLADCRAALLLVSHDEVFLSRLTTTEWSIKNGRVYIRN
jgi:ATPase subunit of ABC transporter with duplicated ATPase domains